MRASGLGLVTLITLATLGCAEESKPTVVPPPAPTTSAVSTSQSSAAKPKKAGPVCKRVGEPTVWGKWANTRTGITATHFEDGTVALGVAIGNHPHVLAFDGAGAGRLSAAKLAARNALARRIKSEDGKRHLQRVTVTAGRRVFADHRDKMRDGKRRIACGPVAASKPFVSFYGTPLLKTDDSGRKSKPTSSSRPAASSSSAPPVASAAPTVSASASLGRIAPPVASAPASAAKPAPTTSSPVVKPAADGKLKKTVRELRDCRTMANAKGDDVWSVGSYLEGTLQEDGATRKWSMRAYAIPNEGRGGRILLHSVSLGEAPKKLHTLEAPVAQQLADGKYALIGRYRGGALAWLLNANKRPTGRARRYAGGYPCMPRFLADDGGHLLVTAQRGDPTHWKVRTLRFGPTPSLGSSFASPPVGGKDDSFGEPTIAKAGEQRWLACQSGARRAGQVSLLPVDAALSQAGKGYTLDGLAKDVYESYAFGLADGKLVVVYITRPKAGVAAQLVSETMSCTVQPK